MCIVFFQFHFQSDDDGINRLHHIWSHLSSPYSSLAMDGSLWLFVVYCCFCLYFGCSSYGANCIGECCESVPWDRTGSYILSQ